MSVSNGQLANQTTFNNAFWSKSTNTTGVAVYRIANTDSASGDAVDNIQREFNAIHSFVGGSLDQTKTYKPTWSSDDIGSANDDIKTRVDAVQGQVETNTDDIATLNNSALKWNKYSFSFSDFSAASTGNTIEVKNLSAGEVIHSLVIKHDQAFEGGSISALDISVGPSGDVTKYIEDFDVFQSVAASSYQAVTMLEIEDFAATSTLAIRAVSTGDDLDQAVSGNLNLWVLSAILD